MQKVKTTRCMWLIVHVLIRRDKERMLEMKLERAEFNIHTLKHKLHAVSNEALATSEHADVMRQGLEATSVAPLQVLLPLVSFSAPSWTLSLPSSCCHPSSSFNFQCPAS